MAFKDVICVSSRSESEDSNSSSSCSSSDCSTSDSDSSNDAAKSGKIQNNILCIDLTESNLDHGLRTINRIVSVHTTKLEDMLIFKRKFNVYVPKNIIQRVEHESKPQYCQCKKISRFKRRMKGTSQLRYNINKMNEYSKIVKEAKLNNYYQLLTMCKPFSIDVIDLKYYNNSLDLSTCASLQYKSKTGHTNPVKPKDLLNDILAIDNDYILPKTTYDIENIREWCKEIKEQILTSNKKRSTPREPKSKVTVPIKVKIQNRIPAKCEYYLVGENGYIESYYYVDDDNLIKYTELKLLSDIKALGYETITSIAITVCCWYGRNKNINFVPVPQTAKSFLKGSHLCGTKICNCCCKPLGVSKLTDNKSITTIYNLENNIGDNKRTSNNSLGNTKQYKRTQKRKNKSDLQSSSQTETSCDKATPSVKKVKTVEDINREYIEKTKNLNIAPVNQTISSPDNLANQNKFEGSRNSFAYPQNIPENILNNKNMEPVINARKVCPPPFDTHLNNTNTNNQGISLPDQILHNPEIQSAIRSIFEQFNNIRLVVNTDGQMAAHIDKAQDGKDLSPADLQVLGVKLIHAQTLLKKLHIENASVENISGITTNIASNYSYAALCEMASDCARRKREHYLKCLESMMGIRPSQQNQKSFDATEGATGSKITKFSSPNYFVESMKLSQKSSYIDTPVTPQQTFSGYVALVPTPMPQPTQLQSTQVTPIAVPGNPATPAGVPGNFLLPPLVPIIPSEIVQYKNPNMISAHVPINKLQKNTHQLVNVPGTNLNNTNSNINMQNVRLLSALCAAAPSNAKKNTFNVTNQTQPTMTELSTIKSNRFQVAKKSYKNPHFSSKGCENDQIITKMVVGTDNTKNCQVEDDTNVDWESRIISNSLIMAGNALPTRGPVSLPPVTKSLTFTNNAVLADDNTQFPSGYSLPKITEVFSLSNNSVVTLCDSD